MEEEEEEEIVIQTFARGRTPKNASPGLGSGKKFNSGGVKAYPLPEGTRSREKKGKGKHTRWESRKEIAELIPRTTTAEDGGKGGEGESGKKVMKALLRPSESAKRAEAVGMKKANKISDNGSNTGAKVKPKKEEEAHGKVWMGRVGP